MAILSLTLQGNEKADKIMALIVLTGYSGLLGGAVLRQLAKSHEVICLGRAVPQVDSRISFVEADLAKADLSLALPKRADAIIHLAQAEGHNRFPDAADQVLAVNVGAVAQLLAWGRKAGISQFVHASTGGLYGFGLRPFNEADPVTTSGPLAHYFATKRSAELLADAYATFFHVVALRYFFIYGPHQRANMLMPRLVASVFNGTPIRLAGKDGIEINPIHVEDASAATVKALGVRSSVKINVAGPQRLSLRSVGIEIGKQLKLEARFESSPEATVQHVLADISLMERELVAPKITFSRGVESICSKLSTPLQ